jgi:threonylcarbamoyladenosine tRNA methylthiotransferase MtaB
MDTFNKRPLRIEVITLGCKVNQAESREIILALEESGHAVAGHWERPDVTIVNTCAVTAASEAKGRKEIGRARRRGTGRLMVTGCMAEVSERETAALAGVDRVVPRREKARLLEILQEELSVHPSESWGTVLVAQERNVGAGEKAKAFIKVQDGCDRHCTYCIVPRARGRAVSQPPSEVLDKVAFFLDRGVREIVLCGINLGGWRGGDGEGLASLAGRVLELSGGFRLRLSSMDLEDVDREMLIELSRLQRLCPHFHLPLQSGSNAVLAGMGRGYKVAEYLKRVEEARSLWKAPAITTDVMVGFPGETEDDFAKTMRLVESVRPSRLHVFRYSRRPGTEAAGMPGQVPEAIKQRRASELASRGKELAAEYARSQIGEVLELLVEETEETQEGRAFVGTTENYLKARSREKGLATGNLYRARVSGMEGAAVIMEKND